VTTSTPQGVFITFEGTEGSGKSTQLQLLADRIRQLQLPVRLLREPGGTPIGEEIRHTLQHSGRNHAMTPEAELLLLNASRAQLVSEVIRPALRNGEVVLCDRFYDSSIAYQAYGRGLDRTMVRQVIAFAVKEIKPELSFLLRIPVEVSEARRQLRNSANPPGERATRDRMEEAGRDFFRRVEAGFDAIAAEEPDRFIVIDGTESIEVIAGAIWQRVKELPGIISRCSRAAG
jgi:dTMP kinase